MSDQAIIDCRGVKKWFGDFQALRGVDLEVTKGEVVVIIGPSGSGKSIFIRCINRLEVHQEGQIFVDGIELTNDVRNIEAIRKDVGMVFQSFNLYPHLDALGNVTLALRKVVGQPRAEAERAGQQALARVGLAEKATSFPNELSGGQQQRVAIARALALEPAILLFDEPTSALDPELVGSVLAVMRELRESGMTMVVVSHEMRFARSAADRVIFMDHGVIVEQGPPQKLFNAPEHPRIRDFIASIEH